MADLRVLFLQNRLCTRSWRHARILADAGVDVVVLELDDADPGLDYSGFERRSLGIGRDIRSMVLAKRRIVDGLRRVVREEKADLVHSNNGPDNLGAWSGRYLDVPVVHDVHDLQSAIPIRFGNAVTRPAIRWLHDRWERDAATHSERVVTVTPPMAAFLKDRYDLDEVAVIENKALPQKVEPLRKLQASDGRVHVVYAGGINTIPGSDRDFLPGLGRLARDGVVCHVYPITYTDAEREEIKARCAATEGLVYHDPVPYQALVRELTQYDYGYLFYATRNDNIRMASPTKLFQYILAGLPVIVHPEGRIGEFVESEGCGIVAEDLDAVHPRLGDRTSYRLPKEKCVLDAREILALYDGLVA